MPIFLPLSSAIEWIGESHGTAMPMNGIGGASSHTAMIGAPLATNAISVPAPTPISMLPATMACDTLLPPVKFAILTSSPCFLNRPSLSATLTGRIGEALASALPTLSVLPANAADPATTDWHATKTAASAMLREDLFCIISSLVANAAATASLRLDIGLAHDLGPFLRVVDEQLSEI